MAEARHSRRARISPSVATPRITLINTEDTFPESSPLHCHGVFAVIPCTERRWPAPRWTPLGAARGTARGAGRWPASSSTPSPWLHFAPAPRSPSPTPGRAATPAATCKPSRTQGLPPMAGRTLAASAVASFKRQE